MPRIPAQASVMLDQLAAGLPLVLHGNLVGIYLYGSLTQRAFNPKRSDIDCIVVTKRDLSDAQFRRLRAWLAGAAKSNPWIARLQMTILIRDEVLLMNSRACLYQFGRLKRIRSDGNPIIWKNVLESGRVIYGPSPRTFVPPITRAILLRALERELGYLREELIDKPRSQWRDMPFYRAYAVMTLCRILYSFSNRAVVSKPRAARWGLKHLPDKFAGLIVQALAHDAGTRAAPLPLPRIRQFVKFAGTQLQADRRRDSKP
jgi:hypothetical protein